MQHVHSLVLLFLKLTDIHKVVLWGFPMGLAQVELDCGLACKSPVAERALIRGAAAVLVRGGRRGVGVGEGVRVGVGVVGEQFFRQAFGVT